LGRAPLRWQRAQGPRHQTGTRFKATILKTQGRLIPAGVELGFLNKKSNNLETIQKIELSGHKKEFNLFILNKLQKK
jgi:hypothetical protein